MKHWKPEEINKEQVKDIMAEFSVPSIVAMLLSIRGINSYDDINRFLYEEDELDDPFLLIDMDKATDRIFKALNNNERICIYG
ncbi:MAG: single-stranded-DNA-specific exonuclease RecJ, partial [Acutalibacteraceae bacterium]|nr:single-stranded-DNA-specific exonuclease RecJ [Acutalibacteraceae bacterium]